MKLSIGRIVHYVNRETLMCQAAIVADYANTVADLAVFGTVGISFHHWVSQDEDFGGRGKYIGGTWHWPERVE